MPVYVFPICEPSNKNAKSSDEHYNYICEGVNFYAALKRAVTYTPLTQRNEIGSNSGQPLGVILAEARRQGRPAILFVEGVRTNGAGVLGFESQVAELKIKQRG